VTVSQQLAGVPVDRVVQVRGADAGHIARVLAEHSSDLAAVVAGANSGPATPRAFVAALLDDLERVAVEPLPAWLPDAADITAKIALGLRRR
jgi:hypothetical protein